MIDSLLSEIRQEAAITRRVLERVPGDKLAWKPHPKSMSLGQLALHIASIPGNLSRMARLEEFDTSQAKFEPPTPGSVEEILKTHGESVGIVQDFLASVDESTLRGS